MAGLGAFLQGAAGGMASAKKMETQQKQNDMMDKIATQQPGTQQPGTQQQGGGIPIQQPGQTPQQGAQAPQQGAGLSPQQPAQPQVDNSWAFVKSLFGGNS